MIWKHANKLPVIFNQLKVTQFNSRSACNGLQKRRQEAGEEVNMALKPYKYYTYFLIDPRNGGVFYVGKGSGYRIKSHVRLAKKGKIDNPFKFARIKEIQDAGLSVIEKINSYHEKEHEAFEEERKLISSIQNLTNIKICLYSKDELLSKKSQILLGRMKPYKVWISQLDKETSDLAKSVFGSLNKAYYSMREDLCALI